MHFLPGGLSIHIFYCFISKNFAIFIEKFLRKYESSFNYSICIFCYFIFTQLNALNRDYNEFGYPHCYKHLTPFQLKNSALTHELAQFIPAFGRNCIYVEDFTTWKELQCPNLSIYKGYVDYGYCKYRHHLKRHLEYCQQNPNCTCYWPECSDKAAQISDLAYLYFSDLIATTALSELLEDWQEQKKFIRTGGDFLICMV